MFKTKSRRLRFIEEPAGAPAGGGAAPVFQEPVVQTPPAAVAPATPATVAAAAGAPSTKTFSEDYVKELREEAAARRVAATTAAKERDDAAKERDQLRTELLGIRTETVLKDTITAAGGNAIAAAAIRGDNVLNGLDPSKDDYKTKVKAAVEKYITEHPELKAVPGTTRSSISLAGGSGEGSQRPKSIRDALNSASS